MMFPVLLCSCSLNTWGNLPIPPVDHSVDPDVAESDDFKDADGMDRENIDLQQEEIEETVEDLDEIEYPENWLHGWSSRVRLLVDHKDIDEGLVDFPLLFHLDGTHDICGSVFRELGSSDNRRKIAVTGADGISEYYVEIEKWNHEAGQAWMWVKVRHVFSDTDTVLYLYFDAGHPDNTGRVDDVNSGPGRTVWQDNSFMGVWHLSNIGGGGSVYDSTVCRNHGTPHGSMNISDLVEGTMGYALDFDGEDDYIDVGGVESNNWLAITVEAWIYPREIYDERIICKSSDTTVDSHIFSLGIFRSGSGHILRARLGTEGLGVGASNHDSSSFLTTGQWHYLAFTWDAEGGWINLYGNSLDVGRELKRGRSIEDSDQVVCIGNINAEQDRYFNGIIDEVRISNVLRTPAWIKATYESGIDDLVTFDSLVSLW